MHSKNRGARQLLSPMLLLIPAMSWCCAPWLVFRTPALCGLLVVCHPVVLLPWSHRLRCGSLCWSWVALAMVCYAGIVVFFPLPLLFSCCFLLPLVISYLLSSFPTSSHHFFPPLVISPFLFLLFALPPLAIPSLIFPLLVVIVSNKRAVYVLAQCFGKKMTVIKL